MRPSILLISLIIIIFTSACSGIKMLSENDIYNPIFLKKIEGIQAVYSSGDKQGAIDKLLAFDNQQLTRDEKAKKYNLLGVFSFSSLEYVQALEYFLEASKSVDLDKALEAQIYLNLSSTYYKQNKFDLAYEEIKKVDIQNLSTSDDQKFYLLKYVLASHMKDSKEIVIALVHLLKNKSTLQSIKDSKYKEALVDNFRKLADSERVYLLEDYSDKGSLVIAFLAQNEVFQRYYMGDKNGAKDVITWMQSKYSDNSEVSTFIKDFSFRMENFSKVDIASIGVVLPFSGEHEKRAKSALMAIETVINAKENQSYNINVLTRNGHNNPFVARQMVRQLIESHHVSLIIGGLFPETATEQYLEARKYGVMFISLSPVYVEKSKKSHLLIEVSGSVQSQLATIFSEKVLSKFGSKVALFYPEELRGHSYADEIWKSYNGKDIQVNALQSYNINITDFRDPVKNFLGLSYPREREEELQLIKEIHELERKTKRSSVRRTQHLEPVIDFDWVFIPSYPNEAIQILPSFRYFDANDVMFIGGPDWLSKKVIREQANIGKTIYFVGDDPKDFDQEFMAFYKKRNKRIPRLLEINAFEAMTLALKIIGGSKIAQRDEIESKLVNLKTVNGVTARWNLIDGIWLKEMDFLKVSKGTIEKVQISLLKDKNETVNKKAN